MSQDKQLKPIAEASIGRRTFINTAALASLAGVAACTDKPTSASFAQKADAEKFAQQWGGKLLRYTEVKPEMVDRSGGALHDTLR